jgi:hypothetical protein
MRKDLVDATAGHHVTAEEEGDHVCHASTLHNPDAAEPDASVWRQPQEAG